MAKTKAKKKKGISDRISDRFDRFIDRQISFTWKRIKGK